MKPLFDSPVEVDPRLYSAAKDVLYEGETLSRFLEDAIRRNIHRRSSQQKFIRRGLEAEVQAEHSDEYYSLDDVLDEVDGILDPGGRKSGQ